MQSKLKKVGSSLMAVFFAGAILKYCSFSKEMLERERKEKEKNRAILRMFSKWIQNKHAGKMIESYLREMNFHTIAIYGMSHAGIRLYEELKNTKIKVEYAIDRRAVELEDDIRVVSVNEELPKVDVIIVTAIYDFPEIAETLKAKTESLVISLEQIIYEI